MRAAAGLILLAAASAATSIAIASAATDSSRSARLSTSARTLGYGQRLMMRGGTAAERSVWVGIEFRKAGSTDWRPHHKVRTDRRGDYRTAARARINGAFRAVPFVGRPSLPNRIRVRSRASLHLGDHNLLSGDAVRLRGLVRPGGRRPVKVIIRGPQGDVVRDATSRRGTYRLRWRPRRTGTYRVRDYVGRNRLAKRSHTVPRRVTVFRRAVASYYGPGLYGGALACGGRLGPGTMGVAHKTLPCGTKVTLRYHGRSVTVPVIDRGPYVAGRDYDLTAATKRRLGFPDLGVLLASR
jgi:hypothetical protein